MAMAVNLKKISNLKLLLNSFCPGPLQTHLFFRGMREAKRRLGGPIFHTTRPTDLMACVTDDGECSSNALGSTNLGC